ncbi:uncharacterized protein [Macaca fascicularis]|uniref:uncharacterized protein n=1 Tax=Macaca fascicularis TaxID=9541 RepID=UPI003D15DEC8
MYYDYLQLSVEDEPANEGNREAEAAESESNLGGPAGRTRGRLQRDQASRLPDSTVALPLREIGSLDDTGLSRLMYWPFSTSDLYNWKSQNARFSDNPKDLTSLLDSVMFTHQPTWDDCQQLLRILFTMEERERIQVEARKLVPGDDGQPTANPDLINAAFPLTRPRWDYNTAEAARSPETCVRGAEDLLKTLGELGYRASATKAQICKSETWTPRPMSALRYWLRCMGCGRTCKIVRSPTQNSPGSLMAAAMSTKASGMQERL